MSRVHVNAIDAILTRTSVGKLTEPAPPDDVLDRALQCAFAAPDHGRLHPARFILVQHEARQRLGQAMADALQRRDPDTSAANLEREVIPQLVTQGQVYTYRHPGFFKSMDSYKDQQEFDDLVREGGRLPWQVVEQVTTSAA